MVKPLFGCTKGFNVNVVAYTILCNLNYGYHNKACFRSHLLNCQNTSAVKFVVSYMENMSFLVIPKSPEVGKIVEKIGLGSFITTLWKAYLCYNRCVWLPIPCWLCCRAYVVFMYAFAFVPTMLRVVSI